MEKKVTTDITHEVILKGNRDQLFSKLVVGDWFRDLVTGALYIKLTNNAIWNVVCEIMEEPKQGDYFMCIQAEVDIKTYT